MATQSNISPLKLELAALRVSVLSWAQAGGNAPPPKNHRWHLMYDGFVKQGLISEDPAGVTISKRGLDTLARAEELVASAGA